LNIKKFMFYTFVVMTILGAIFAYILYTEGVFERQAEPSQLKPFEMKCEAGKCAAGKCASTK
jgi:hypothetical protein